MIEHFQFTDERTGESYTATLKIDTEQLARQLARSARRNKSLKSKLGEGAIVLAVSSGARKS